MDILNSQILEENISRILSIIGVKPSPLNEAALIIPFLLKQSDNLINFFTKNGANNLRCVTVGATTTASYVNSNFCYLPVTLSTA
jgi:hypothetical protein